jgi:conjugative relaxase-like TrwC/TraI family protein
MHGGLKIYRGSAAAARHYVESYHGRADDYYLAEGTGLADHYLATPDGVRVGGTLAGDAYEAWVGGYDPATGAAKGRLRTDEAGVRFVEVVVNGPKSWSLAAALHPDISAAYDAAQDAAGVQIIGWLAEHATTRVGPRGRQVQVPVQGLEAAVVRHYASRAGDPHRHLHLQVNARVFAEGKWRGLHTVGMRDGIEAINGIGHAAVFSDPGFRGALAAHGYTVEHETGEVVELAPYVGAFSARAAQITRNIDRYEAQWRAANPGQEPGRPLQLSWRARAWAEDRPGKIIPADGTELTARWVAELRALGYTDPGPRPTGRSAGQSLPVGVPAAPRVGELDRDAAVETILSRLAAKRSGWNAPDIRGQAERLIASTGLITTAAVRIELAEDLTARALAASVPLLPMGNQTAGTEAEGVEELVRAVPEHVRALTSPAVLAVEDDITSRMIARASSPGTIPRGTAALASRSGLDPAQRAVVAALAGPRRLVVVEGAAGAGKTTTLAATRAALAREGRRLVVVTPTRKAAEVAARQVGSHAWSAAWLVHQHGYRWNADGAWTRLRPGEADPETGTIYAGPVRGAVLAAGDLLLCDEAGMLDQDTARALLTIADEHRARLALVGDRHQLPAVGRGGVLDLATRWTPPEACLSLGAVHRFTDPAYASLSVAMRTGQHPEQVFDTQLARGQIQLHPSETERTHALADATARLLTGGEHAGGPHSNSNRVLVVADTREQVAAWERIGVGDRVATRRNDRDADVANRETWTVTAGGPDGGLTVAGGREPGRDGRRRELSAAYVREHVELAYATTGYGAQGETVTSAHLLLGEHTGAAAAYVAMTRGRQDNTAHLVADTAEEARAQWVLAFGRDRADLGPAHAAALAAEEASRYATHRPLDRVLVDLYAAWSAEQDLTDQLTTAERQRDKLAAIVPLRAERDHRLGQRSQAVRDTREYSAATQDTADRSEAAVSGDAARIAADLQQRWAQDYPAARAAAQTIADGAGPLGLHRGAVRRARSDLDAWAEAWRPVLPGLPTDADDLATDVLNVAPTPRLREALTSCARRIAEDNHPEHTQLKHAAASAAQQADHAMTAFDAELRSEPMELGRYSRLAYIQDPAGRLAHTEQQTAQLAEQLRDAQARVHALELEPAIRTLPVGRLQNEHDTWRHRHDQQHKQRQREERAQKRRARSIAPGDADLRPRHEPPSSRRPEPGRGISF